MTRRDLLAAALAAPSVRAAGSKLSIGVTDWNLRLAAKPEAIPLAAQLGFEGYKALDEQIAKLFKTGKPPVAAEETIELMAFMEAADDSKRQDGKPVKIEDVMAKAKQ